MKKKNISGARAMYGTSLKRIENDISVVFFRLRLGLAHFEIDEWRSVSSLMCSSTMKDFAEKFHLNLLQNSN